MTSSIDECRRVHSGSFCSLRPIVAADAALTLSWRQGDRANLLNRGAETVEQQARWLASRPASELNFVIDAQEGLSVGMLSLVDIDLQHGRAEPARFLIGDEAAVRGRPVAVEAMGILYRIAFDELRLRRVYGTIAEQNKLMLKWQQYMGMKVEGTLRKHALIAGEYQDLITVGMLESEYRAVCLPRMQALMKMGSRP